MTETEPRLTRFLARCRRIGRRRLIGLAVVDALIGVAIVGLLAIGLSAWTLRGDLLRPVAALAILAVGVTRGTRFVRDLRRLYGGPTRIDTATARTVGRASGPLRRGPSSAGDDASLRLEILGAAELSLALAHGSTLRSPALAKHYIRQVADRMQSGRVEARLAVPRPSWRHRLGAAAALVAIVAGATLSPGFAAGWTLLATGSDGRPLPPPQPVWSSLAIEVTYPPHTGRPPRTIPNPTGALRLPAGTEVHLSMVAREPAEAARVLLAYDADELGRALAPIAVPLDADPNGADPLAWRGDFVVRGSGRWTIVLLEDEDDPVDRGLRRSDALPLELEPDGAPEIDLVPPSRLERQPSATDSIDVRIHARDDFGIARADLVVQLPSGDSHAIPLGAPSGDARSWRHRHTWDLSQVPIEDRTELIYWVEVRDNDPGLGLEPLPDPPGKVTRSATMRLLVHDDEAEHAANIQRLSELRDMAVDQLAARMTTTALDAAAPGLTAVDQLDGARALLAQGERLLAALTSVIDALSMDTMARERDVAILADVHRRLGKLQRAEQELHKSIPPGIEHTNLGAVPAVLTRLGRHNARFVTQLEDEVIRIDDLVDGQLVARLETLVARLRATQQKLVQLLEQLAAGDESVRPQIEQLKLRRREDLRRIAEVRAMLHKQIGEEFMNPDALELLRRMEAESNDDMALDDQLDQAREELQEIEELHDQVQERAATGSEAAQLSDEERQRMKLLRELSRLQDEESGLRTQTRQIHEQWREQVAKRELTSEVRQQAAREVQELVKRLKAVNDARLGREGRRGLEDAKAILERMAARDGENTKALEQAEALDELAFALRRAVAGSESREKEGQQMRQALRDMQAIQRQVAQQLPAPKDVLDPTAQQTLDEMRGRQAGLQERARELLRSEVAQPLPEPGRNAMQGALRNMGRSEQDLEQRKTAGALDGQKQAWDDIQRAIDSLRQGGRPPPRGSAGDASTEAEQDRSLRDELIDAMREGAPRGFQEAVKHYYEELLR